MNQSRTISVSPTTRWNQNTGTQTGRTPRKESTPEAVASITTLKMDQSTSRGGGRSHLINRSLAVVSPRGIQSVRPQHD
ncbi:MAG: hypothetical protein J07HX64_02676 [halophilic archaeon J07HX64]|nr:MAG: hypothetical protein J07HX64_02676 [halophilic archaeon J07HX64]